VVAQGKKGPAEGNLAEGRPAGEQDAAPICLFHVEPVTASLAHTRFVVLSSNVCSAIVVFRSKKASLTTRGCGKGRRASRRRVQRAMISARATTGGGRTGN